ncbi:MAG: hypothetical protein ACRDQA_29540 [Nocardioidaceae bacterium]
MTATQTRQALTLRLPPELHDELRTYAFLTGNSINETITDVLANWIDNAGKDEMVRAATTRGHKSHRNALDKLRGL